MGARIRLAGRGNGVGQHLASFEQNSPRVFMIVTGINLVCGSSVEYCVWLCF